MVSMAEPSRLIVGISGASGVIYGVRLLQTLKKIPVESHLVMTRTAEVTLAHETRMKVAEVRRLAMQPIASTTSRRQSRAARFAPSA